MTGKLLHLQISIAIQALAELSRIEEAIPIESFPNPKAEAVDNVEEDIFNQIAEAHTDNNYKPRIRQWDFPGSSGEPVRGIGRAGYA